MKLMNHGAAIRRRWHRWKGRWHRWKRKNKDKFWGTTVAHSVVPL